MDLGAGVILETVNKIAQGDVNTQKQDNVLHCERKSASKLFKSDCIINWDQPKKVVHNFIRGLNPFPGAWTMREEQSIKIHQSRMTQESSAETPGTVRIEKNQIFVACQDGWLEIIELQVQGKRKMISDVFLNGIDRSKLNSTVLHS